MRPRVLRIARTALLLLLALAVAATALVWWQARREPTGAREYVALGSSFAAGADLGPLQRGSPWLCARSTGGYPQHLARMLKLSIVDMTCGGAKTTHLLNGGQFFQGPQIRVIDKTTRLVTVTVGGNDLGYTRDLSLQAARNSGSAFGWLVRQTWNGPAAASERDYAELRREIASLLGAIRQRSPDARIVFATYPPILPPAQSCSRMSLSNAEVQRMHEVADRFSAIARDATRQAGAILVDMHTLGARHHACSAFPWTYGWTNAGNAPFHPTARGARATALAIADALSRSPTTVAAVGNDDAASHQAGGVGRKKSGD